MISLEFLEHFANLLHTTHSPEETYHATLDIIDQVVDYDAASLFVAKLDSSELELVENRGEQVVNLLSEVAFAGGSGLSGWMASQKRPMILSSLNREKERDFYSMVSLPLWFEGKLVGVLNLGSIEPGFYSQDDANQFEQLAVQLSLIISQLMLRHELVKKNTELEKVLQELQNTQKALVDKERLSAIGEVVVKINHEINNPLAIITTFADLIKMKIGEDQSEAVEMLDKLKQAAFRISELTKDLENLDSSDTEDYEGGVKMIKLD